MLVPILIISQHSAGDIIKEAPGFPFAQHIDQKTLAGQPFEDVYYWGKQLFTTTYNSVDGVGANLSGDDPISIRFSRVPRADLPGFLADPLRVTGPSAARCADCHEPPRTDGAGGVVNNEPRDPFKTGDPSKFIMRGAPHIFGSGALQRLAEEASEDLQTIYDEALVQAAETKQAVAKQLITTNGVDYGEIVALPSGEVDVSGVVGVDVDLVVKPYQLKGSVASLRLIVMGPADNSLGMQPIEFFGRDTDFDNDGVSNEFNVGDITAITAYIAAQPRPVTKLELHKTLGGKYRLAKNKIRAIKKGKRLFTAIGCAGCHKPKFTLRDPVFREPSENPAFRFSFPPSGIDLLDEGLDPDNPVQFNLTDNPSLKCKNYNRHCFLNFKASANGGAIIGLYGDLKRYDMGPALAESVDEVGTGASVWKTRELWGVGSTGPWLHDGRATTLTEAILFHGGESLQARNEFTSLSDEKQRYVIEFLENLVIYTPGHHRKHKYEASFK